MLDALPPRRYPGASACLLVVMFLEVCLVDRFADLRAQDRLLAFDDDLQGGYERRVSECVRGRVGVVPRGLERIGPRRLSGACFDFDGGGRWGDRRIGLGLQQVHRDDSPRVVMDPFRVDQWVTFRRQVEHMSSVRSASAMIVIVVVARMVVRAMIVFTM